MTEPGRNDPCPCGSGQKYKKCCLAKDDAARAAARPRPHPRDTVLPRIMRFAGSPQFDGDHDVADILFWAEFLDQLDDDKAGALLEADDSQAKYWSWFIWDLDIDEGRTPADMFVEQKGRSLEPAERDYVDRLRRSYLSLYQVEAVEIDRGLVLRDLLSKESVFVHERLGSRQLVRSDLIGARVVVDLDDMAVFEGGMYLYDVSDKAILLDDLKRYQRAYRRQLPGSDRRQFLKRHGMVFNYWWLQRVVLRPGPAMMTAEGDEMVFVQSRFDVADPAGLRSALAASPDVQRDDDGADVYTWGGDGNGFRRILATLRIEGDRVTVETMSRDRAERCREWLTSLVPGVTFRASALETVAAAMNRLKDAPPEPEAEGGLAPDVKRELERQMLDAHYRRWLDEPVPALRNATPREAAASRPLRPLLIDLLREFDNHRDRASLAGAERYDTSWLWTELGLRRAVTGASRAPRGAGARRSPR